METAAEIRSDRVSVPKSDAGRNGKPFATEIWNFLISLKLAIWTLILLAVTSILGTVVEQNQPPEKYREIYEDWAYHLMDRFNVFDMYHSWWFLFLLCLFALNLTCCTVDRLPRTIRTVRNPKAPGGAEFVPELIHNRSGVGSHFVAVDLNKDGAPEIITSTNKGTHIFYNRVRTATSKPAVKK